MSHTPNAESGLLIKIREWVDDEGREPDQHGDYEWPSPPEYTEYSVAGQMRADVLAKLNRPANDPCGIRLIQGVIEGGYSEFTVEHDYPIEVWIDDEGQSQRIFHHEYAYSHEGALAEFLKWLAPSVTPPGAPPIGSEKVAKA